MAGRSTTSGGGLTVAVTGPTGDIGRSLLRSLERSRSVKKIVAMARRPFDPAASGLKRTEYRLVIESERAITSSRARISSVWNGP